MAHKKSTAPTFSWIGDVVHSWTVLINFWNNREKICNLLKEKTTNPTHPRAPLLKLMDRRLIINTIISEK